MSSEWVKVTLDQIKSDKKNAFAMGPFGSRIKAENFVTFGVPVIKGGNLNGTYLNESNFDYLTPEKAQELSTSKANKLDIVITHRGTLGQVGLIHQASKYDEYIVSQSQLKLSFDLTKVDPYFVYYYLRSPVGQSQLLANTSQVGVPAIAQALSTIRNLEIYLPPKKEQINITFLLRVLDDRITLLRETNQTLEAIAQAIFKSWFVDFDPVRAKMEGRAPEGMDEETAALFPDAFEESELGLMPKGWYCCSFSETVEVIGGGTPKTSVAEYWGGNIPWFSVVDAPNLSDVFVLETEKNITQTGLNNSSTKLLPIGTTIISARGTVGRLALTGRAMAMNQSCYGLRGKAGDEFFTYFNTARLVEQLKQRAHGSVFDTITQKTFSGISVVYPTKKEILAFDKVVQPLLERIKTNLLHISTLTALRDTLLPRLISGQLSLHDVDLPEFSSTELV